MKRFLPNLLVLWGILGAIFVFIGLGSILVFLGHRGWDSFVLGKTLFFGEVPMWQAIWGGQAVWDGIWPAFMGTLSLVGLTLAIVIIPGLSSGLFLAEYAGPRQRRYMGMVLDMAAGVPSIVIGLVGFTLIIFMRNIFPEASTSLLLSSCCLALLVLPILAVSTCEAISAVPEDLRLNLAALGFSKAQALRFGIIPSASRGILSGVLLTVARSAEDAAVIMLTGAVANIGFVGGAFDKFQALPFTIFYTASQYQTQAELDRGFGAAIVLLILSSLLFLVAWAIERTYHRNLST